MIIVSSNFITLSITLPQAKVKWRELSPLLKTLSSLIFILARLESGPHYFWPQLQQQTSTLHLRSSVILSLGVAILQYFRSWTSFLVTITLLWFLFYWPQILLTIIEPLVEQKIRSRTPVNICYTSVKLNIGKVMLHKSDTHI